MGACCSCQRGVHFHGFYIEELDDRDFGDHEDIILRGDAGALIRLQGSSRNVSMFTQQGKKGINQDAMTVWESFAGDRDMFFCGVFDGHGPSGHKVSRYIRDLLPAKVSLFYKQASVDGKNGVLDIETVDDDDDDENDSQNTERMNPFFLSWKARLIKCFQEMDEELEADASIETYCSGTTSVCVLKKREHLLIANLGDSRAVLCTRDENNQLVSDQLTVDLKPNLPSEAARIRSCQGRVLAMDEEPNVYRIWMPDEDLPGLAMARAFGDFCLKDFGVISTPKVTYRKLTDKDEFVVLATDGIWDVLSNDDVVKIVASARKRPEVAKLLIEKASRVWRHKYPFAKMDDCAVVCLFFKRQRPSLTKSVSEVTHLSLNYTELGAQSYVGSTKSDDALDTVLNCKVHESSPDAIMNSGGKSESMASRPRKRRTGKKLVVVGE